MTKSQQFLHAAEHIGETLNLRAAIPFYGIEHAIADLVHQSYVSLPAVRPDAPPDDQVARQRLIVTAWAVGPSLLLQGTE